ncbi:MAG: D-alanine--D-alanine ligase [Phycisphaeraceae bacterium]
MGGQLRVLVLAGGPDREREVSLNSGSEVAAALREAGHEVRESDVLPDDVTALDAFNDWPGDVIFPVLHGRWGEGGGLQRLLDQRALPYVGCRATAAALCMDKAATKAVLDEHGLPTPAYETLRPGQPATLAPPVVVKAVNEGSSIGLSICHNTTDRNGAILTLGEQYAHLLVERYVAGMELTVGVIEDAAGQPEALPALEIVPAEGYYDYQAKYQRDDTQYRFDIALPAATLAELRRLALRAYEVLGVRHLGRVDFLVDAEHRPWLLEVNTIPGFTGHSLLPMAARQAGLPLPALVDRLVRLACTAAREPGRVRGKG